MFDLKKFAVVVLIAGGLGAERYLQSLPSAAAASGVAALAVLLGYLQSFRTSGSGQSVPPPPPAPLPKIEDVKIQEKI